MNKYKLNFLRWLTLGEFSDEILIQSFNWKFGKDKFSFTTKCNINIKDWRYSYGTSK